MERTIYTKVGWVAGAVILALATLQTITSAQGWAFAGIVLIVVYLANLFTKNAAGETELFFGLALVLSNISSVVDVPINAEYGVTAALIIAFAIDMVRPDNNIGFKD